MTQVRRLPDAHLKGVVTSIQDGARKKREPNVAVADLPSDWTEMDGLLKLLEEYPSSDRFSTEKSAGATSIDRVGSNSYVAQPNSPAELAAEPPSTSITNPRSEGPSELRQQRQVPLRNSIMAVVAGSGIAAVLLIGVALLTIVPLGFDVDQTNGRRALSGGPADRLFSALQSARVMTVGRMTAGSPQVVGTATPSNLSSELSHSEERATTLAINDDARPGSEIQQPMSAPLALWDQGASSAAPSGGGRGEEYFSRKRAKLHAIVAELALANAELDALKVIAHEQLSLRK
jgi:hypothetical protein